MLVPASELESHHALSTSLSPQLAHLSPRTPQSEGHFTSHRGSTPSDSSAGRQSHRSVSSSIRVVGGDPQGSLVGATMRRRVPSGVPMNATHAPTSPTASSVLAAEERVLPPIPTASFAESTAPNWKERLRKAGSIDSFRTRHDPMPATVISSLPGFSDALNVVKGRPSNMGLDAAKAFGNRVRSFAFGLAPATSTTSVNSEGAAPILGSSEDEIAKSRGGSINATSSWFKSNSRVGNDEVHTRKDEHREGDNACLSPALLPPIDLPPHAAQHGIDSRRAFVEDDESDNEDDDPSQTIRVIHAGNIILEQSGIASSPNSLASGTNMWSPPPASTKTTIDRNSGRKSFAPQENTESQPMRSQTGRLLVDSALNASKRYAETHPDRSGRPRSASTTRGLSQDIQDAPQGRPFSISFASASNMERNGTSTSSTSNASHKSLLLPNSASSALADVGESLRWSQKFPEGTHMSRARSSRLSMGGMAAAHVAGGRRNSAWSGEQSETVKSGDDEKSIEWSGNASEERSPNLDVATLGYAAELESDGHGRTSRQYTFNTKSTLSETQNGLPSISARPRKAENDASSTSEKLRQTSGRLDNLGKASGVGQPLCQAEARVAKWNGFKWILFVSVIALFCYGMAGLVGSLLTWARTWERADVTAVVDADILIFFTLASMLCVLTSVVGISGTILNSRPILSLYAFLLWPTLLSILVVGYAAYKRENLRLDRKLNMAWSRYFDDLDRLRLQNNLHCCGYYTPLHQATFSRNCYPRTSLPGCKGKLYRYEKAALKRLYTVVFTVVFVHLANIAASLLCSNHVNASFGKGLTPRAYRLDMTHVRRNAINIIRALKKSEEQAALDELQKVSDPASNERTLHDQEGGDLSMASIDLGPRHCYDPSVTEKAEEIGILRLERNRGLLARALQVPYFSERPVPPPKSPARAAAPYAFNGPQATSSSDDSRPRDTSEEVRGLGFTMSLERHQARIMQDQLLARQI